MTYAIAAAGTGGHVYPGLAVGQALVAAGVAPGDVAYFGGDRLEASTFPDAGFPFEAVVIRGVERRKVLANLEIPAMLLRARSRVRAVLEERKVNVVLGFGNYITVPVAMAAKQLRLPLFVHEQNAHPGIANRLASRWAGTSFVSFPDTPQLHRPEFTGNPLRSLFWGFDRGTLRGQAMEHYSLDASRTTVGVYGGSLGARAINDAVAVMLRTWDGPAIQVVHLVGRNGIADSADRRSPAELRWVVREFEERMDWFFAACDVVVARSGGSIAEILATATPSVLVPGGFGSGGHQAANARYAAEAGAAVVLDESDLARLTDTVRSLVADPDRRVRMAAAARRIARPDAAQVIARRLMEAADG